jgi:hypothetical protein
MGRVHVPIASDWARRSGLPEDRIVGSREIGGLFGVTRQRVGQIRRSDPSFPRPVTSLSGGPLWYRAGIEAWASIHRPGTVASGRFGAAAIRILEAAESAARNRGHKWLSDFHLWLAFIEVGPSDGPVMRVFATMGFDHSSAVAAIPQFAMGGVGPSLAQPMNPAVQQVLETAAGRAAAGDRDVTEADIAVGLLDHDRVRDGRHADGLLDHVGRRGLDIAELRRRLDVVAVAPSSIGGFEIRTLSARRVRPRPSPRPTVPVARNPLGRDPWAGGFGAVFGRRKDGRSLVVDGEQWFFRIDADGFYIRTSDGRPVGYRYRIDPPPRPEDGNPQPVNGFVEALPMPPDDVADWPHRRFGQD